MINLLIIFLIIQIFLIKKTIKLIKPEKAKRMINQNKIKNILDVRSKKEWNRGNYPNSVNIPIEPFDKLNQENLEKFNKKEPILIYCRSGRRALIAANRLKKFGFKDIYYINENYKSLL